MLDIEAIRERCVKISPAGTWHTAPPVEGCFVPLLDAIQTFLSEQNGKPDWSRYFNPIYSQAGWGNAVAVAFSPELQEFIAHSVQDIDDLLLEIANLRAAIRTEQ